GVSSCTAPSARRLGGWRHGRRRPTVSRRPRMKHLAVTLLSILGGLAASGHAFAQPAQKVVFALNWFAVGDHAAYWVAVEKGYYRERGLEGELQNSKGSTDTIAKVDTERRNTRLADASWES